MADRSRQPTSQSTVAIIGGGLAGLAGACALSDSGFSVTVFERRPYLGGRASSYEHPGTGEVVDNCQHVLFGSCTNLITFYRKIGILDKIRWFDRMTFIEPGGRQSVLEPTFLPAPLHVTPSFLGFKFLDALDKAMLSRALAALMLGTPKDDGRPFQDWLIQHRQTPAAIERFWKPILVSALSEDLDRIAIPYAAQVVRESMKAPMARRMGVPTIPLTHLYDAASAYINARGGSVRLRSSVQSIPPLDSGFRVRTLAGEEYFDYGVLAVPFDAAGRLISDLPGCGELMEQISHFATSPITGVHLWFDRQISDLPHAILLDRTIQWMFHKSMLLAPRSSTEGGPSYVELVISSSKSLIDKSRQEIIDLALSELREFFPGVRDAALVKATVIKEVNATFSPYPGIDGYRPSNITPWPRIFLAGDWTGTGWPATMEGAVRSGYLAAEALSQRAGRAKMFLVPDLPPASLMRLLG
jgi:squalene-associated FAD-dependent desaturase